jgi:putative transposase
MRNQMIQPLMRLPARPATRNELIVAKRKINCTPRGALVAQQRSIVVSALLEYQLPGLSLDDALDVFLRRMRNGSLPLAVSHALAGVTKGKDRATPSRTTFYEWVKKYRNGGKPGLVAKHQGRVRTEGGWEAKAVEIYSQPSKISMAQVHRDLCRLWAYECTYEQVSGYLESLPSQLGKNSPARLGKELHKQQQKPFVKRHTNNLKAGSIYMADGYRADVYLAHPVTGDIWRPEIMHIIDLRSRYLVGYRIMANEGSYDVMIGWAECFARHDHVPPLLYVDNGSGYKNKITEIEDTSYYRRAGVQYVIHSLPHNPKGKGHVEQYHRIVRDGFLKSWQPLFYCGDDMAQEVQQKTVNDCKNGKLTPPSLAQFCEAYNAWIADDYHRRPHPENKYVTRAQVWAELDPIPPHATTMEMARPCEKRTVQRAQVQLHNRSYKSPDLYAWNGMEVLVEFDILNHHQVTIRAASNGQLICDAPLVKTIGVVSDSFMADKERQALVAASARIEKKAVEARARAGLLIDAEAVAVDAMQALPGEARLIENDDEELLDLTLEDKLTGDEE